MFFTWDDVVRICREVAQFPRGFVSDELRGWSWPRPPVLYTGCVRLTVSDIVGEYCSTGRDVYLRYVAKVRERITERILLGSVIHKAFQELVTAVKRVLYGGNVETGTELFEQLKSEGRKVLTRVLELQEGTVPRERLESVFWSVWSQGAMVYSGMFDKLRRGRVPTHLDSIVSQVVPLTTEFVLDGSLLGLGSVRVDAVLYPSIPVEIKLGDTKRAELALAGYALVMESLFAQPIDFGIAVTVRVDGDGNVSWSWKLVPIDDNLRLEFLHERDRKADIVEKQVDPGPAESCPRSCPYYDYCVGRVTAAERKAQERPSIRRVRIRLK